MKKEEVIMILKDIEKSILISNQDGMKKIESYLEIIKNNNYDIT